MIRLYLLLSNNERRPIINTPYNQFHKPVTLSTRSLKKKDKKRTHDINYNENGTPVHKDEGGSSLSP